MRDGYYVTIVRVKDDAVPIDNVTKFAWSDEDYEEVKVWHEYTDDELKQIKEAEIMDLESKLNGTDYRIIKMMEKYLLQIPECAQELGSISEQRQEWRDRINELED